jgi:hypothetical protein
MSWESYLKASRGFARIAFDRSEDLTIRVQNAFNTNFNRS